MRREPSERDTTTSMRRRAMIKALSLAPIGLSAIATLRQAAAALEPRGRKTPALFLLRYDQLGRAAQLSVPTSEHYLPLLYALAVKDEAEPIAYFNDAATMGSISMRSLIIG